MAPGPLGGGGLLSALQLHGRSLPQAFQRLARTYADNHATMSDNDTDRCGASFYRTRGITNGALWYSFAGGEVLRNRGLLMSPGGGGGRHRRFPVSVQACRTSTTYTRTAWRSPWSWAATSSQRSRSSTRSGRGIKKLCSPSWSP